MKLVALDTVRISSAGGRIEQGQHFVVPDHEGEELVRRGIARKQARAPANKAAKAASNKKA